MLVAAVAAVAAVVLAAAAVASAYDVGVKIALKLPPPLAMQARKRESAFIGMVARFSAPRSSQA
jgi:hypothetical protein